MSEQGSGARSGASLDMAGKMEWRRANRQSARTSKTPSKTHCRPLQILKKLKPSCVENWRQRRTKETQLRSKVARWIAKNNLEVGGWPDATGHQRQSPHLCFLLDFPRLSCGIPFPWLHPYPYQHENCKWDSLIINGILTGVTVSPTHGPYTPSECHEKQFKQHRLPHLPTHTAPEIYDHSTECYTLSAL
ncbi:hypothetical protein EDB86DRAFT_1606842 [Lactarius hatsudake]|nr:hypothetical protein EDB86DRAFT_1606842 [Lactarius hatsudake]